MLIKDPPPYERYHHSPFVIMRSLVPVLLPVLLLRGRVFGFASFPDRRRQQQSSCHGGTSALMLMANRNKLSAKERRKRRAKRLPPRPVTGKPVNFNSKPLARESAQQQQEEEMPTTTTVEDAPPMERAQQLLEAQRKSVDMLTHIRERVEALDYGVIQSSLSSSGYSVVDNFLDRGEIIDDLAREGLTLFQNDNMEVDLTNLGSGEYVCKIQGGEEQYKSCPRSVEFVVSMTKHMAPAFEGALLHNLDPSACMATMRTFDKKSQQASLKLLSGELPERPLGIVATEDKDARKISILYYPGDGGGGITVENDERAIPGKRDRLILLKSDSCLHRKEPWNGDKVDNASCIELHLVQGSEL